MQPVRIAILATIAVSLAGCELFLDINDDDDDVGEPRPADGGLFPPPDAPDATGRFCEASGDYVDIGILPFRYRTLGSMSYQQAQARCRVDGAELASINSNEEFDAVTALVNSLPVAVTCNGPACAWLGMTQNAMALTPDELWSWQDGSNDPDSLLQLGRWATDQPDDVDGTENGEETCAMLDSLGLRDESCAVETFAVCKCFIALPRR